MEKAQEASQQDTWDDSDETKEEYIARMLENAERDRFELMLTDHTWQQYMEGWGSREVANNAIEQEIKSGGDYYSYVEKLDAPEKEKEKLIRAYEEAYIDEMITMDEEHPDYPELARKHAVENARKAREQISSQ